MLVIIAQTGLNNGMVISSYATGVDAGTIESVESGIVNTISALAGNTVTIAATIESLLAIASFAVKAVLLI